MLSPDSQATLANLLPPTAFSDHQPQIDPSHPSHLPPPSETDAADSSLPHILPISSHNPIPELLVPSLFTDSHFLSAARTFQDHLFSSQLTAHSSAARQ